METDFYDQLNVTKSASIDVIKQRYHDLSRIFHPDKVGDSVGGDENFNGINRAYKVLSDPTLRKLYDKYGLEGVQLAESVYLSDGDFGIIPVDDRLSVLERRIRSLLRNHEELRSQAALNLSGENSIGLKIFSFHPFLLRRVFSSLSQSVTFPFGSHSQSVTFSAASHLNSSSQGVNRFSIIYSLVSSPLSSLRLIASSTSGERNDFQIVTERRLDDFNSLVHKLTLCNAANAGVGLQWIHRWSRRWLVSLGFNYGGTTRNIASGIAMNMEVRRLVDEKKKKGSRINMEISKSDISFFSRIALPIDSEISYSLIPSIGFERGIGIELVASRELFVRASEEQFPSVIHWGLFFHKKFPVFYSAGFSVKFKRGNLIFGFPIEVPVQNGASETYSILLGLIAVWCSFPYLLSGMEKFLKPKLFPAEISEMKISEKHESNRLNSSQVIELAKMKKMKEEQISGLIIIQAIFDNEFDVTNFLMSRVEDSKLEISESLKSSLFKIDRKNKILQIKYSFQGVEICKTFRDDEFVLIP